jgi:DNA polymerase elongation subunit (family B)
MNNYILSNADTDAIMLSKPDQSVWTENEKIEFLSLLNSQFPEKIRFEDDGTFSKVLIIKAKNYILLPEGESKLKIKGSALKDAKKPPILKEFMMEIVNSLLDEKGNDDLISIYNKYCVMCFSIKDIKPWCKKVTITDKITRCKGHNELTKEEKKEQGIRTNESKVYDAILHVNKQQGDKVYLYFKKDKSLGLSEEFNGTDHDEMKLLASIQSTLKTFLNVLNLDLFPKYALKKNKNMLQSILEVK